MDYHNKYLKYKLKYLLKKQIGGVLSDDITRVVPIIQDLEKYNINLPQSLITNLSTVIQSVKEFYRSTLPEIQEKKRREQEQKEESENEDLPDIIIKMLWIVFYKSLCDTITTYHESLISYRDDSLGERISDVRQKLWEVDELLKNRWIHYLPPLLSDIKLSGSKLKKEMLFSEGYRDHITHQGKPDPFVEPEYGYISPPEFNDPRVHSYDELVDTYRSIRNAENRDELSMEQIVEDLPVGATNSLIRQIYNKYDSYHGDIDVARLLFDKYGQMTYSQLLQNFPERIFVNLEPEIHRGKFHVDINDLFS